MFTLHKPVFPLVEPLICIITAQFPTIHGGDFVSSSSPFRDPSLERSRDSQQAQYFCDGGRVHWEEGCSTKTSHCQCIPPLDQAFHRLKFDWMKLGIISVLYRFGIASSIAESCRDGGTKGAQGASAPPPPPFCTDSKSDNKLYT